MVFGDYKEISSFSLQLYKEIKEKEYALVLFDKLTDTSRLADKTPTDLLRIYGQINIHRIDSILNTKIIEDEYKKVDNEFNRIYEEKFSDLVNFALDMRILGLMKQYLSYQPFPVEKAKCLRLYKIKVKRGKVEEKIEKTIEEKIEREEELTPYEFAKELRKSYLERIEGIYTVFSGGMLSKFEFKFKQALHGELAEIKCLPFPLQEDSWKDTVVAWSKGQNWGARVSRIEESVSKFLVTYFFSLFLDLSKQRLPEKAHFGVIKRKKFVIQIQQFAEGLSFKAYVIEKTIQEFFKYLIINPDPQDLAEIKVAFSEEMQNEKKRNTFVYFFMSTVRNYENLRKKRGSFDYAPYQETLKAQFKDLKHLIFKYKSKEKKGKKYILSKKKEKFYDLLFSYLMAIHVFEVLPMASLSDRRRIFKGIWRMESSERLALYGFLCCQVRKPIEGRQQSKPSTPYIFSKLPFLRRYSISKIPPSPPPISGDFNKINEFLKNYSFSETEEIRIKIQFLFFHRGLMTKMTEADVQGFQPIDFAFCVKFILNIQKICGFQLPANIVSYILTWNYLNKKGIEEIKHLTDRLNVAKAQARELILKDEKLFFISPRNRQHIDKVISCVIPKSTFIPKNEVKEAFYNCLQYTIYPHIAPSYFYPFIFLAFELSDARFNRLKDWGTDHLGMFRKIEPYQSALRVDACWKKIGNEEYFQIHLTYFPSSHKPQSFYMEETLQISRERLRRDWPLCQILRIFSIFLADEFEPIKRGDLKSGEQRKHENKDKGKQKVDEFKPIETGDLKSGEQRKHEDKDKGKQKVDEFEPIETGDLKSGEQRQPIEKKEKKIKLDKTEPESEFPEPPKSPESPQFPWLIQFPKFIRYKSGHFEEVLNCFDNPIFSYLWNLYEADDKDEVGMLLYEFFFQIKRNIRKKMDGIFFPKKFPVEGMKDKDIIKNALEGTIYSDGHYISLIPLNLIDYFPQYSVKKEDYSAQMSVILESVQKNLDFIWKNFFTINVGTKELIVNVKYRFSVVAHCDYHRQHASEVQSILNQKEPIERDSAPHNIEGIFSKLETSGESDEDLIQTEKHEIIFFCPHKGISFSMAYEDLPSEEILLGQIVMLKWKCFKAFYGREGLI